MPPKFKPGDVLEVIAWDRGEDRWEMGMIAIIEHHPNAAHTSNGLYDTQHLTGEITWVSVNADVLNNADTFETARYLLTQNLPYNTPCNECFYNYIGNMNTNKALKVLYGSNRTK